MGEMIKVQATDERLLPREGGRPGEFLGWRTARGDERADRVLPSGRKLIKLGVVDVPDRAYYRKALLRGDIVAAAPAANKKQSA